MAVGTKEMAAPLFIAVGRKGWSRNILAKSKVSGDGPTEWMLLC